MKSILVTGTILCFSPTLAISQPHRDNHRNDRGSYGRSERYASPPRSAIVIPYHNHNYHYAYGYFYRPFGAYFQIVVPPVGIYINLLPRGYRTIYYPGGQCYYYNGIYYRQFNNQYQVIDAPAGAEVPDLLADAKAVEINGEKLYKVNDTYYKEEVSGNGNITYKVIGKPGEAIATTSSPYTLQVGDVIQQLPEGCKTIVLNGKKLFVSNLNTYFEEVTQSDNVAYKVVGNEVK